MKLRIEPWTEAGAVGLEIQQWTAFGEWVTVLDTSSVGTFPNYTAEATVTAVGTDLRFRYRWETATGVFTQWLTPVVMPTLSEEGVARLTEAVIAKATRILAMSKAPLGWSGELLDDMVATVRSDRQIEELLYGLRFRDWDVDITSLVEVADVVRHGLQIGPDDGFPEEKEPDVQRAIDSACSWVAHCLLEGIGIA